MTLPSDEAAASEVLGVLHDRGFLHARHARSHDDQGKASASGKFFSRSPRSMEFDVGRFNLKVVLVVNDVAGAK
jgi:hypothetical protein